MLSPSGAGDIRIVLTWKAIPEDLDSHLTGPNPGGSTRFHVFFNTQGNLTAAPFAALDLDDTDSYGPETITITQFSAGGVYRYSVHDFDNLGSGTSSQLSTSGAKVQVYGSTGLLATFAVPPGPGTLWTVFEMTGPIQSPIITRKDQMSFATNPANIPSPPAIVADDGVLIGWAVRSGVKRRF